MTNKVLSKVFHDSQYLSAGKKMILNYLNNKNLDYSGVDILNDYLSGETLSSNEIDLFESLNINNVRELESYMEFLIPNTDKKANGVFFTPSYIVDFIIEEVQPKPHFKNFDMSCGSGAFLLGLADYYHSTYGIAIRDSVRQNIYGADILNYNVDRAKVLLTVMALEKGEVLDSFDFHITCYDSLKTTNVQFDSVIGNPPYVKIQDLPVDYRDYLESVYETVEGSYNLYYAFLEKGYRLLNEHGKLCFITPNSYIFSKSARNIRSFFKREKCITKILDFSHRTLFEAKTYTAITMIDKCKNDTFIYDKIQDEDIGDFLKKKKRGFVRVFDLDSSSWNLYSDIHYDNIQMIENQEIKLSDYFDLKVGIATLCDKVYLINSTIEDGGYYKLVTDDGTFNIEVEATKPIIKASNIKKEDDVKNNTMRVIFPYKDGYPINVNEFRSRFPNCYSYLLSKKDLLDRRDGGRIGLEPFYLWGRSQGLKRTDIFIITTNYNANPRFVPVMENDYYMIGGVGLYPRVHDINMPLIFKKKNIDVLIKVLNSSVMDYYVKNTSNSIEGGFYQYSRKSLIGFSVPNLTQGEIDELRSQSIEKLQDFIRLKYKIKK